MEKIVGSNEYPILSICNTLIQTSALEHSPKQWKKVAEEFIQDEAEEISDCIEYKGYSVYEAYEKLLQRWVLKVAHGATLDCLLKFFDKHKLFDSTDELRKRFGFPPNITQDSELKAKYLFVKNENRDYILRNISRLAGDTNVTESLLLKLEENKIISKAEMDTINANDDDEKSLALYKTIANNTFFVRRLIEVLVDDGQFAPSWTLKDVYNARSKDQKILEAMTGVITGDKHSTSSASSLKRTGSNSHIQVDSRSNSSKLLRFDSEGDELHVG